MLIKAFGMSWQILKRWDIKIHKHAQTHHMLSRYGLLQARLKGQGELANESGWAVGEMADSRLMVVGIDEEMDKDRSGFPTSQPASCSFQRLFFFWWRPGRVYWHRWTHSHTWLALPPPNTDRTESLYIFTGAGAHCVAASVIIKIICRPAESNTICKYLVMCFFFVFQMAGEFLTLFGNGFTI